MIKRINNATEKEVEKIEDPIEKYKLEKYLNAQIFFTNLYGNIGIEQNDELMPRIKFIIEYLKSCQYKKIIVVSHSGLLDELLRIMFNICIVPKGKFIDNNKNCSICYCTYSDNFLMISPPNTEHFSHFR